MTEPTDSSSSGEVDVSPTISTTVPHTPHRTRLTRRSVVATVTGLILILLVARLMFMFWVPNKVERREDGRLSPCPTSPNCVCSHDDDAAHRIEPLKFSGSPHEAWLRLNAVVAQLPRTRVLTNDTPYLHVEFTTPLLRFVDDVEFLLDESAAVIHVRSASRVGHSDLDANRKRVEAIRRLFES